MKNPHTHVRQKSGVAKIVCLLDLADLFFKDVKENPACFACMLKLLQSHRSVEEIKDLIHMKTSELTGTIEALNVDNSNCAEFDLMCCLQIGLMVWLLALFTIELALVHHAVWKVSFRSLPKHRYSSFFLIPPRTIIKVSRSSPLLKVQVGRLFI